MIEDKLVRCEDCVEYRYDSDDGEICNDSYCPIPDVGYGVYCKRFKLKES